MSSLMMRLLNYPFWPVN